MIRLSLQSAQTILTLPPWVQNLAISAVLGPLGPLYAYLFPRDLLSEIQSLTGTDPNSFRAEANAAIIDINRQRAEWERVTNWLENVPSYPGVSTAELEAAHRDWSSALTDADTAVRTLIGRWKLDNPRQGLGAWPLLVLGGVAAVALIYFAYLAFTQETRDKATIAGERVKAAMNAWQQQVNSVLVRNPNAALPPVPRDPWLDENNGGNASTGWGVAIGLALGLGALVLISKGGKS